MKTSQTDPLSTIRRQRLLLIIAAVALVSCAAGLVAVWHIKSPAQQAAEQSPPPPSVLTAPVLQDVLAQQLILRGTAVADSVDVNSWLTVNPAVVTRLPHAAGDTLAEGDVAAEISGRPVFVLAGPVPSYRALVPGLAGADVSQLQAALQRLGLLKGAWKDGTFDQATVAAVKQFYKNAGYDPSCDGSAAAVCLGEVVFVPSLPATIATLNVKVGDNLAAPGLMTLQLGRLTVTATVPSGQQAGLKAGLPVLIADDAGQRQCQGTLTDIGAFSPGTSTDSGNTAPGYPIVVTPGDTEGECLDFSWLGLNVRLVIDVQATDGPVLIVPSAALQTAADGSVYVEVWNGSATRQVYVTTGLVAAGNVEVAPVDGQTLAAGDLVVIG